MNEKNKNKRLRKNSDKDEDYIDEDTSSESSDNSKNNSETKIAKKNDKNDKNDKNKVNNDKLLLDFNLNNNLNMNLNSNQTRKRRNSDSDIYYYKIIERSKHDQYFKKQQKEKQIEILEKETEIYNYFNLDTPLRYKIVYSNLPISTKSLIIQKIDMFEMMSPMDNEYNKLNKWLKGLSQIPFDNYIEMPVSLNNSEKAIQEFLYNSFDILRKTIYGQSNAKNKIMQILAQWITNPKSTGQVIALEGAPGVGKTSLVKNGVSKALNRPFSFYALGGETDVSNLEGHSYTYEGAHWGRITEMLMESKVMNPVIFFDELDKISASYKGNEINGLLTHLTDPSQNNIFQDKYFSGIDIDLSKTIFFFSYNNIENINPILKDRLTIVKFTGYLLDEKINIVKDFIIPDLLKNIGFNQNDIKIDDNLIRYIITKYTKNEEGVRNIKRCIEELFLKINLLRLIKNNEKNEDVKEESNEKEEHKKEEHKKEEHKKNDIINYNIDNLKFPLIITTKIINDLIL